MEPRTYEQLVALNRSKTSNGYSSLHVACITRSEVLVELLLKKGVDVNSRSLSGQTPLYLALDCRYSKTGNEQAIIALLLNYGASLVNRDSKGDTPLHHASIRGTVQSIETLLAHGADIDALNSKGQTPLGQTSTVTPRKHVLLRHVIKMKAANLHVGDENSKMVGIFLENPDKFFHVGAGLRDFHSVCEEELAAMLRSGVAGRSTIFDFLEIADFNLTKFARMNEAIDTLERMDLMGKFPLYGSFVKVSLERCFYRRQLLNSAEMLIESELVNVSISDWQIRESVDAMDENMLELVSASINQNLVANVARSIQWISGDPVCQFLQNVVGYPRFITNYS